MDPGSLERSCAAGKSFSANGAQSPYTVAEICDAYLSKRADEIEPETLREKTRVLARFCNTFGQLPAANVDALEVECWIKSVATNPWYRRGICTCLEAVFNFAVKYRRIPENPIKGLSFPEGEPFRPATGWEYRAMLRAGKPIYRRVLVFLEATGCRPKELCSIRWTDWRREARKVVLDEHKTRKKTRQPREIYLGVVGTKLLEWLWARRLPGQEFVFLNAYRRPWARETLSKKFRRLRNKVGLPRDCHQYGLRHKLGFESMESGNGEMVTAQLLGHRDLRSTRRYVHMDQQNALMQAAIERIREKRK